MAVEEIKKVLQKQFPEAEVFVESADDVHFQATIISDNFENKKLIERQKMVYACVGSRITSGEIHALSLKTFTKKEWSNK